MLCVCVCVCVSVCLYVSVLAKFVRAHNSGILWPILTNLVSLERSWHGLASHLFRFLLNIKLRRWKRHRSYFQWRHQRSNLWFVTVHNSSILQSILKVLVSLERSWQRLAREFLRFLLSLKLWRWKRQKQLRQWRHQRLSLWHVWKFHIIYS